MSSLSEQAMLLATLGSAAFGLASLLWGLRVSDGARGIARKLQIRASDLEEKLARTDSLFGAHPGVVLVWDDDHIEIENLGHPHLYGSPMALAGLLRFTSDSYAEDPVIRILDGIADLEARDAGGQDTTLRARLTELRQTGAPFSLTLIAPSGHFLEADGRTAGARAVLWLTDSTIKSHEESSARGRIEEARQIVARDPTAFLEMLGKAPFPAWRMSSSGKLQWANAAYLDAVDANDLETALDQQLALDQVMFEQGKRALTEKQDITETRFIVMNGQRRALRMLTFPLSSGVGGMGFDVTDEQNAYEKLDRHVKSYDETLNNVAEGVAIFAPDRKLVFHNNAFSELWGLEESFLMERPMHGELLDRLREKRKLPSRTDYPAWRAEELAYYQDIKCVAEDMWSLPNGRTLRITRQRHPLGGLLLLFRDITGELNLQTRYNALIKTQSTTLDNLHEAVVVFGGDARLRLSNRAFIKLWELNEEDVQNEPDFNTLIQSCLPLFNTMEVWDTILARVTDPSPQVRQETNGEMIRTDGTVLTYLTQPLPDGATLIAFIDITATRRVEGALLERAEAFEAADRLKTEFVQNVSYQLRSPLTTIIGYADFLNSDHTGALTERQRDFVRYIQLASDQLSKLIENILDLAMIETGRVNLELSDINVKNLINESVDMAISQAADTKVAVKTDIKSKIGSIRADERRIRQILFNLISNALRFTEAGDEIIVSAEREQNMLRLVVSDTGKGVDFAHQAKSFDSFTSGDQRGAGLGLALVRSFVELHKGHVALRSNPGEGTQVTCILPDFSSLEDKDEMHITRGAA